jgi:phenylalanyl-tRNA synthetase alpha chain
MVSVSVHACQSGLTRVLKDERFLSQFANVTTERVIFTPFSKYAAAPRDVSFWLPNGSALSDTVVFDHVRDIAGDSVESVKLVRAVDVAQTRSSSCTRAAGCVHAPQDQA